MNRNAQNKENIEIKWNQNAQILIKQNSKQIVNFYAGKLLEQSERREKVVNLIRIFKKSQQQFYYMFLQSILVWKIYWYFSPLYRQASTIFKYLSSISFPHLTKIVINQSHIFSIQQLTWLKSPLLKEIDIEENYIVSLKPLVKTNFPELIVLKHYYNNFNHGQYLSISRTKWNNFHCSGLFHFHKEIFYQHYFKFQPNLLKKIYVQRTRGQTLQNKKIIDKLKEKFFVSQFYVHFSKV